MSAALFFILILMMWPAGKAVEKWPRLAPACLFLIGFIPFFGTSSVDGNLIYDMVYRGSSRDIGLNLLDLAAVALIIGLPKPKHPMPFRKTMGIYFVIAFISIAFAENPLFSAFGVWKIMRMIFVVRAVSLACETPGLAPNVLKGVAWGIVYVFVICVKQRYVDGYWQVAGTFPHQNSLGMAVELTAPILFALALSGQGGALSIVSVLLAGVCILFGLSRGAMAMFGVALFMVFAVSTVRKLSWRKTVVAVGGALAGLLVLLKAWDSIVERFATAAEKSATSRDRYEIMTERMINDHPFGIGINQYSYVVEHGGYSKWGAHLGGDVDAIVHNVYLLTWSEIGPHGLFVFLLICFLPLLIAIRAAWYARADPRGDLMVGCAASLLVIAVHGTLEWGWRQLEIGYLFFILVGLVGGINLRLKDRGIVPNKQLDTELE